MGIKVTHIFHPEEWVINNDWDSHRPALWLAWDNTRGFVIEMGCGHGSTELLGQFCNIYSRPFVSFDTDEEWANKFSYTLFIKDVMLIPEMKVDLLFVDSKPGEQRKEVIEKWKDHAKVIVIHDTQPSANYVYGMAEVLNTFKYRLDYTPEGKPWATIVSNFVDVEKWVE